MTQSSNQHSVIGIRCSVLNLLKTVGIISITLIVSLARTQAQETLVLPGNPASTKWYQIKTPGFKVLYTKGFEMQAQRMANTLETIREPEAKGMNTLPKRIPILLQNNSSQSNAFVTLAPRRSEFYAMPTQNYNFVGGMDWMNLLATHEYRHIAQFQRSITGFNKLLFYTFGQEAVAAMAFASAPQWFWEGDAVATETAFTSSGRGRMPNFDLIFRTNLLEGRTFNYNKQYLRSYKNFIPNHYVLGYEMVSYLRKQTGRADSWGNIAKRTWNVPFIPFAFSRAVKKEVGLSTPALYKKMAGELKSEYEKQLGELELTPFENVTVRKNETFTDYLYPQVLSDGSIAVLKSGIGDIDQVVILREGRQIRRFITGPLNESGFLSAAQKRVVWNEYRFDPRWPVRDYSIIRGFDFGTKMQQVVTRKSRYAGAALSPNGERVLTVETDLNYQTSLVVLDYLTGQVEKKFTNPENAFYSMARWGSDGSQIISLKMTPKGKSVVLIDYRTGKEEELLPPSNENVGHPVLVAGYLLYNSPYTGIDNIYALNLQSRKQFQVTSAKYGAYNPCLSADGKTLYYNNQGRNGMDVVKIPFNPSLWKSKDQLNVSTFNTYQHLVNQEGHAHLLDSIPSTTYSTSRYHKLPRIFNLHSWGAYVNSDLTIANVGITSKDILSTTQIKAGYDFDIVERTGALKASVSVQTFYPILDFTYSQGNRSVDFGEIEYDRLNSPGDTTKGVTDNLSIKWHEQTVEGGIRFPLNITISKFYTNLSLSNYVGATRVTDFENSIDGGGRLLPANLPQYFLESYLDNGTLIYNSFNVSFYNLLKRSTRDVNSKWGQAFYFQSKNTPYKGDFTGRNLSFTGYLYFPGLFKHHSLWGYWAYQSSSIKLGRVNALSELRDNYLFRNQIPLPRGMFDYIDRHEKIYSMSLNYTMPLWYPDLALGPLLNVKRVRVNAYFDYAFGSDPKLTSITNEVQSASYASAGGELKFDINVMRFLPEFDIGIRYSYGIQPSATKFELLIGAFNF